MPDARVPGWLASVPPTDHASVTMSADAAAALMTHVSAGALPLFAPQEAAAARALIEGIFQWDPRSLHQRRRAAASVAVDADVHAVRLSRLLLRVRFRPGHAHVETLTLAPDADDEAEGEDEAGADTGGDAHATDAHAADAQAALS